MGNAVARVSPDPLDRPRITRSKSDGLALGIPSPASPRTDFATHPARPRTDSPAFHRADFARAPARQSDGLTFGIPSPAFPRTDSPALGRPTPIQPFPNPDMDGINRHATTSQPSFGSNTRTTRFRLNRPTSLIRQLQPILKNNSTSTKKLAQDRPFRVLCKRSAARHPRKDRVGASRW